MLRVWRRAEGAVLIEALVAAVIVGIAMLFLVALLAHEARLTMRAAAQRDAYMLLEAALESLRAGAIPLEEGDTFYEDPAPPWLPIPVRRGATLEVEILPIKPSSLNLWEVTVTVRYRVGGDRLHRSVVTRMWHSS